MLFEFNRGISPIQFISIKYSPISHYAYNRSRPNYHIDKIMKANLIINPFQSNTLHYQTIIISSRCSLQSIRIHCNRYEFWKISLIIISIFSLSNRIVLGDDNEYSPIFMVSRLGISKMKNLYDHYYLTEHRALLENCLHETQLIEEKEDLIIKLFHSFLLSITNHSGSQKPIFTLSNSFSSLILTRFT